MRILITGGAGFVGSSLARKFKRSEVNADVVCLDNLKRRGSELNTQIFAREGITFVHGDVRHIDDLSALAGNFDLMIEASAEPSVLAGLDGSPNYLLQTNLVGTLNCLEYARKHVGHTVFLSTSRVYSIAALRSIPLIPTENRFEIDESKAGTQTGLSAHGVAEHFATHLSRSLYGASKLASELFIQEYADTYKLSCVINRCGVIAGPGQFGKVDQGVFTLWVANHYFGKPLKYTGFGGKGQQVRDLLHPEDLHTAIVAQLDNVAKTRGETYNLGGGRGCSTSMRELTALCQEATGRSVSIDGHDITNPVDIPLYISDARKAQQAFGWSPRKTARDIVVDIAAWLRENENSLRSIFA
jgi:CDP-paratose 2-epimerase